MDLGVRLACNVCPQRAFFFCTFSCSLLALLAFTVHLLRCFLFLNAANRRLRSVLDSTKHVRCGGPAMLSYPSSIVKKRRSSLSSFAWLGILHHIIFRVSLHVTHESSELPACERKLTFLSVTYMTDMSYIHIRMHIHCENRSLIQSPALNALGNNQSAGSVLSQASAHTRASAHTQF